MITVTVQVEGQVPFSMTVQAVSIRAALAIVQARYPDAKARIAYPIDPESFFAGDDKVGIGLDGYEVREEVSSRGADSRLSVPEESRV